MYCRRCGKTIPQDSEFCMHCGTKVGFVEEVFPVSAKPEFIPGSETAMLEDLVIDGVNAPLEIPSMEAIEDEALSEN